MFKNPCRVADSTETRMDVGNLARVFGPTIVGHSVPNPDPMTILQDTKRQPKVSQTRPLRRLRLVSTGACHNPDRFLLPGRRTPAVAARRLLEPVCEHGGRAAQPGAPHHRKLELLLHPRQKYERARRLGVCGAFFPVRGFVSL